VLTSPFFNYLRSITRKLGLNKLIGTWIASGRYEDRFGTAFTAEIQRGDTVWDIGANIGLYTAIFCEAVGSQGRVVAFEPVAECFEQLQVRFSNSPQVVLENIAIGSSDGVICMVLEANPLASTHRVLAAGASVGSESIEVEVRSVSSFVRSEPDLIPNVIKIDVEGHEGAVLDGMKELLSDARVRCIGIEVHFGLLDERGESHQPKRMHQLLTHAGYKVRWTDPSHLLATRK
jgi:FkbM family methyltransferase